MRSNFPLYHFRVPISFAFVMGFCSFFLFWANPLPCHALKPVKDYTKPELIQLRNKYQKWTQEIKRDYKFLKEDIAHLDEQIQEIEKQNQMLSIRKNWAQRKQIKKNDKKIEKLKAEREQVQKKLNAKGMEFKSQEEILAMVNQELGQRSGEKAYSKTDPKTYSKKKRYRKKRSSHAKASFSVADFFSNFSTKLNEGFDDRIQIGSFEHDMLTKRNVTYAGGAALLILLVMILKKVMSN